MKNILKLSLCLRYSMALYTDNPYCPPPEKTKCFITIINKLYIKNYYLTHVH